MLRRKEKTSSPAVSPKLDDLHCDLLRGVVDRPIGKSQLPKHFFERTEKIAKLAFKDHSGDIFLGAVGGTTKAITHPSGRIEYSNHDGLLIGLNDDRHMLTVAGSRAGKGRSAIVPNLLSYGGSAVVIDPKAENAGLTALYRNKELGQKVYILDPFGISDPRLKKFRTAYNPLTTLDPMDRSIIEDAGRITDSIVVPGDSKDAHWDYSAKALIESIVLHVCTDERLKPEERNLVTVADMLSGKFQPWDKTLRQMMSNGNLGGHIAAAARAHDSTPNEEKGSILSTARRHMQFLSYQTIRDVLDDHEFDLNELRDGKATLYICLPTTRLGSCRSFLRMMINLTLGSMDRIDQKPEIPILVIMDEFAVLGKMKEIEDAAGQIAGFGIKLWPIAQGLSQLKALYKDRWETFLGNTGLIQAFGNVDHFTLSYLSKLMGNTSIITATRSAQTREQINAQGGTGMSEQEKTTALMAPEEIASYFARDDFMCRQLLLMPGQKPFIASRVLYDQHEHFKDRYMKPEPKNGEAD